MSKGEFGLELPFLVGECQGNGVNRVSTGKKGGDRVSKCKVVVSKESINDKFLRVKH